MTDMQQPSLSETHSELHKVGSLIATASRLVSEGRLIDLSALQTRTQTACDAVVSLSAKESRTLLPDLEKVISDLDLLTAKLKEQFGDLPNLQNETTPRIAASAYSRNESTGQ
ncbi:MAG: hypothetical protein RIC29_08965 [Rhodospirillaceae bacterium]